MQNAANQRRLVQLEDENTRRRNTVKHKYQKIQNNFHSILDSDSSTNGNTFITRSNECTRTSFAVSICKYPSRCSVHFSSKKNDILDVRTMFGNS